MTQSHAGVPTAAAELSSNVVDFRPQLRETIQNALELASHQDGEVLDSNNTALETFAGLPESHNLPPATPSRHRRSYN